MRRISVAALLLTSLLAAGVAAQAPVRVAPGDTDQTLRAMSDEMKRSTARLRMGELERPFYVEYRLLDIDQRTVTASFGAVLNSSTTRNRLMSVDVRVGDYLLDSSNFLSDDAFRGFIGSTGQVGIDRDYESLRQDLWLATDQAYKEALARLSRKRAYIASLARKPDVPDFSREQPVVLISPRTDPDWTNRNWEDEAKTVSAIFRKYPALLNTRVTFYFVYTTYYLMNSEGAQIRTSRSLAVIEAGANTQSDDGMRLHNFYSTVAKAPKDLPPAAKVSAEIERICQELMALRQSAPAPDYSGPVLFEAQATAELLAQMLPSSISGARPPLSTSPYYEQMMQMSGRSEWVGRLNQRVLPAGVSLRSDPTAREFKGQPLIGGYEVDEEGVQGQSVTLVDDGILKNLLMSRRPSADFAKSNGHARAGLLGEPKPSISNLFFDSKESLPPAEMKKKFLEMCKAQGREWCVKVTRMDNPAVGVASQDEFMELFMSVAGGASSGLRTPLLVYKVYVADGREELMRGARLNGITLREMRRIAAIGNDAQVYNYFLNVAAGLAGTSLGAFGSAQGGVPAAVVAPSMLLEDVEVRGARGEPRRPPILPAPPLN